MCTIKFIADGIRSLHGDDVKISYVEPADRVIPITRNRFKNIWLSILDRKTYKTVKDFGSVEFIISSDREIDDHIKKMAQLEADSRRPAGVRVVLTYAKTVSGK